MNRVQSSRGPELNSHWRMFFAGILALAVVTHANFAEATISEATMASTLGKRTKLSAEN